MPSRATLKRKDTSRRRARAERAARRRDRRPGRKGLTLQRYKGLGEMNPEQLWDTTLDPDTRTHPPGKVKRRRRRRRHFSRLMGDVVEPRREFIQANAL